MLSAMSPSVVILGFLLTLMAPGLHGKVVMVYSVTRHGARNVLPKTALLQESDSMGGPTLLPEGQSQAYRAGAAYRARYIDPASCSANNTCLAGVSANNSLYGVVNTNGVGFSNYNLNVRSSALDRTIMTALSFFNGVLPPVNNATATRFLPDGQQVIPVYSQADSEDILIRAYSKCQAYQDRLTEWFGTEEFQTKSQESQALRNSISALVPNMNTSLANWWNVYDAFNVWRTYSVGNPTPDVDNATFAEMQSLGYWLETAKMQSNLTVNLLGGTILADMLQHVEDAVDAVSANVQIYYKVVHLSGHYNTQLGTLAALELDTYPGASSLVWLKKIPSLAALMAFEVLASDEQPGQYAVRLVIQDGPAANYTAVALPCSQEGDAAEAIAGPGSCTLDAFRDYVAQRALNASQWCTACQDSSTAACQLRTAKAQLASLNATADGSSSGIGTNSTSCSDDSGTEGWKIAVSVVLTFLGTAALTALGMWWLQRRQRGNQRFDPVTMAQLSESAAYK